MNDKKQWELYENTHKTVYYIVSSTAIEQEINHDDINPLEPKKYMVFAKCLPYFVDISMTKRTLQNLKNGIETL